MSSEKQPNQEDRKEGDIRAIQHLQESVAKGKHWYLALLEAVKLWKSTEETYKRRHYSYLIDGEAFDWLLLAERLCLEIQKDVPEKEKLDLLFFDRPPVEIPKEIFKKLMGTAKYRAYLNYLYGVLVEDALVLAVVDDIHKERRVAGWDYGNAFDKAYKLVYGQSQQFLLDSFRREKKYTRRKIMSLTMLKEFSYWLFKYRLKHCEKSRIASDTQKALVYMHRNLSLNRASSQLS
jgi:hypothetical protein